MKFSRGYERDADLNGARMMASVGYNPIELAHFFEKLEAKLGSAAEPKGLALWMSSHPGTGSRVQYVSDDIRFYPKRDYTASSGQFAKVKAAVAALPPPKKKPAALLAPKQGASRSNLPRGFKDYQAEGFAIAYPPGWQAGQAQQGGSVYLYPQGGVLQKQNRGVELLAGAMIDYYSPQNGAVDLNKSTDEFVQALKKDDSSLRSERPETARLGGKPALMTRLSTRTSSAQDPDQAIFLYTAARPEGLWYVVLAAPSSRLSEFEPLFRQMTDTVQFPD
jgi:predicted Zn-dependent protease